MTRVLLTGATGFVGRRLAMRLSGDPALQLRVAGRRRAALPAGVEQVVVGPQDGTTDWRGALVGCDAVVHVAGRAHILHETASDSLEAFRTVNTAGTLRLARQAADAGVRRFVFVSSVKVNGERTLPGQPFRASDTPRPADPYAVSKHEAEVGLRALERERGLAVVVVRPVLVYGPGVGANFRAMLRWVQRGVPLPLGALRNRRSLVSLENLVDLLARCLTHPAAAGATLLVSDGEDLSTTELLRRVARVLDRPSRLVPVPASLLELAARAVGRRELADRLCGSLQVDAAPTRELLGWTPPQTLDDGLRATVEDFLAAPPASATTH